MRIRDTEDSQGYYNHEDKIIGLHFSMGKDKTKSNERRSKVEPVELDETMGSL